VINPVFCARKNSSLKVIGPTGKSGRGLPRSKTLARETMILKPREASWSAPALGRFLQPYELLYRDQPGILRA
jgi:hypothetical protein